jgi:hypothetical protein
MRVQINCTANLGDFMNAIPVLSGLAKYNKEPISLIIKGEMRKFNDIKEFLMYQDIFKSVEFDDEIFSYGELIQLSSWTRMDRNSDSRPVETCRYENWIKDNYNLDFDVDDDFQIKVQDMEVEDVKDKFIVGDRWSTKQDPSVDTRRNTNVVENGANPDPSKVFYLDYTKPLMYNCNIIKQNPNVFITTFTGIGIIADLMNKETVVCWDEDMRMWDGQPVEFDFERHYYLDRKSRLIHVKELGDLL